MTRPAWSVDRLILKNNVIFGHGWVLHPDSEPASLDLVLTDARRRRFTLPLQTDKTRNDVAAAFPAAAHARHAGYLVIGATPGLKLPIKSIAIAARFANGDSHELAVPVGKLTAANGENLAAWHRKLMLAAIPHAIGTALTHLVRGELRLFARKAASFFDRHPTRSVAAGQFTGQNVQLIIDHSLGGGANHYRAQRVEALKRAGHEIAIASFRIDSLIYTLTTITGRGSATLTFDTAEALWNAIDKLPITAITYNTAVSFPDAETLPAQMLAYKQRRSAWITVLIHDYFPICPSHCLLDPHGQHCRLPDPEQCRRCLDDNAQDFLPLYPNPDIDRWRAAWGALLSEADEIVTFSQSSRTLLCQAYPALQPHHIQVRPHTCEPLDPALTVNHGPLVIGIVGHIGLHKGAEIVRALAEEIARRGADIRIAVIGTIDATCPPEIVTMTGPYERDELPRLIAASGANLMLFPSVWPETFSYVVQELMSLALPIAAFNLGAPAERLADYSPSLLLDAMPSAALLDRLTAFHAANTTPDRKGARRTHHV